MFFSLYKKVNNTTLEKKGKYASKKTWSFHLFYTTSHLFCLPHLTPTIEILIGKHTIDIVRYQNTPTTISYSLHRTTTHYETLNFSKLWPPLTSSSTTLFQAHKTPRQTIQQRHISLLQLTSTIIPPSTTTSHLYLPIFRPPSTNPSITSVPP